MLFGEASKAKNSISQFLVEKKVDAPLHLTDIKDIVREEMEDEGGFEMDDYLFCRLTIFKKIATSSKNPKKHYQCRPIEDEVVRENSGGSISIIILEKSITDGKVSSKG